MSNVLFDAEFQVDDAIAWGIANGLRPAWVLTDDLFVEGDIIRFREIVAAPGTENDEWPQSICAMTEDDEFAIEKTDWQTVPLKVHPREFGIEVVAA